MLCVLPCVISCVCLITATGYICILVRDAEYTSIPASDTEQSVRICTRVFYCYDLEGASSKLIMLDSGCCPPPVDGTPPLCDIVEEVEAPTGPPAGLGVEEEEESRPPRRRGCESVLTSSSSSSSSSSILGQADWSSTRFRRSLRALRASCLERKEAKRSINPRGKNSCARKEI